MAQVDLKSPGVQRALLVGLASLSLLGLFFFSHVLPFGYPTSRDKIQSLKGEYEKKATELARARATVADLPRFEAEYERLHEQWAHAAELVPTQRQLPTLMRRITLAAQQNGVAFTFFRPGAAKTEQHYTETPVQLAVYGNYHQIGAFLADLANMRRIVTVSNVHLKGTAGSQDGGPTATTTAEFSASAYHLSSSTAMAEAPAADRTKKEDDAHDSKKS